MRLGRGALWGRVVATTGAVACVALTLVAVYAATRPTTPTPKRPGIHVGVSNGDSIPAYITSRASILEAAVSAAAQRGGDPPRYALVSFTSYLLPAQLAPLLAGTDAAEVFLRSGSDGVVEASVRLIPADIVKAMSMHAGVLDSEVADLQTKIQLLTGHSPDENTLASIYQHRLHADLDEMNAYGSQCACTFGAVVHGSLAALYTLSQRPGVRVVDLVPLTPDVTRDTFMPLVPGQKSDIASPPPIEDQ